MARAQLEISMLSSDPDFHISQTFYGEKYFIGDKAVNDSGYSTYDDGEGFRRLAALTLRYFSPKRVLDVGCAKGYFVNHLREAGIETTGIDFSHYAVSRAPDSARVHLAQGSVLNLPYPDRSFDLVTCFETLEHLWPADVDQAMRELHRVSSRMVFASIPSFDRNDSGPLGYTVFFPSHREDAAAGRNFREMILDSNGNPHQGHLSLATFTWWTQHLHAQGLRRLLWLERTINRDPDADPQTWHFYVCQKDCTIDQPLPMVRVTEPLIAMGVNDDDHLGSGWYDYEQLLGGRWASKEAVAYCLPHAGQTRVVIEYTYPHSVAERLAPTVEIAGQVFALPHKGPGWNCHLITLASALSNEPLTITIRTLTTWVGNEVENNGDTRPIGIGIREIGLVDSRLQAYMRHMAYSLREYCRYTKRGLVRLRSKLTGQLSGGRPFAWRRLRT
jgi:ubiquinone/menaquinone biosynthesis C-methylase UbiE